MNNAYLRDANTGLGFENGPYPFQRIPIVGEFVWSQSDLYQVVSVEHAWDEEGPFTLIDVTLSEFARNSRNRIERG